MSSKYDNSSFNSNKKLLQKMTNQKMSKKGGESKDESNKRTFKVIELNGKVVDFGNFTIKKKTSGGNPGPGPIIAARKALQSISKYLKVNKNKLNVNFMIQEITRGKTQYKIYGPYNGYYRKYSSKELKEKRIKTKDGKYITLEYEPVVKLQKANIKTKKGGG
tara:strand:+ start:66 stop:554 length:489 start_codon:yes stop_codon:yes gene_type:complete